MAEEILSLSTFVERATVHILSAVHPDGRLYELRNSDELGAVEYQTVVARAKEAQKLQGVPPEKLSAAQARTLSKALADIVSILLPDLEPEVLEALSDLKRAQIVNAWVGLRPEADDPGNRSSRRTGAGSSRGSKGSTAAARRTGSTSRSHS